MIYDYISIQDLANTNYEQLYEDELFKYFDRKALLKVITQVQKAILNNGHYSSTVTKCNHYFETLHLQFISKYTIYYQLIRLTIAFLFHSL